jgi:hypothetical protein
MSPAPLRALVVNGASSASGDRAKPMDDAERFRDRARHCRMLATLVTGQYVTDELLRLARDLELEAIKAEIRGMFAEPPIPNAR